MSIVENTVTDTVEMANKTQNLEVVAQYQFDFGLRPAISYVQSKGKQLNGADGSADLAKYIQAGATYYFNKNMNVWVDYRFKPAGRKRLQLQLRWHRRSGGCRYYLPVLISRPLCFMPQKQDFGPVFLSLLEKMCVFQKQAGFFSANGWHFVNLPLT